MPPRVTPADRPISGASRRCPLRANIDQALCSAQREKIAFGAESHDPAHHDPGDRRLVPKRFAAVNIGEMHFEDPYAWDWAAYMKKRHEYTMSRGKMLEDKVRMIHNEGNRAVSPLSYDDILSIISANPADYSTNRGLSATTIMAKLKVPYNKAQRAAKEVMLSQKDMERAEKET